MLRGFRWQLIVLVMALALFTLTLITRMSEIPDIPVEPVNEAAASPTPSLDPALPTLTPLMAITETLPTQSVIQAINASDTPTFREALIGQVQRLNPILASLNPVDRDISSLIYEGLTRIDQYGEAVPLLAKGWVISSDGLEYIINLREDVLWQDGLPFSSADVAYTISLLQASDFPGDPSLGKFWRTVEIQPLDTHLVRFRLTQPLGNFLGALQIGILPEHALRGTTAGQIANHPFNLSPIGTGPYQLEALRMGGDNHIQSVDLRAAPVYRQRAEGQGGYTMDRLTFQLYDTFDSALNAMRDKSVDGLAARNEAERNALLTLGGVNLHTALEPTLGILIFNWTKDSTRFFREQRVRVALQTGLDRTSIIDRYLPGIAVRADSPLVPGSWAYTTDLAWPQPNPDAARELLANVNIQKSSEATEEAPSGALLSFRILTVDDPALVGMAQDIATQWSQLNVNVSVDAVDQVTFQARLASHDFDTAIVELSMGESADPDVYQFWDQGQYPDEKTPNGKNYGGVDDRRIAEELERARRDPNGINRSIRYQSFQQEFIERAIAIPLYYPLYTYATASQIGGVQLGFMGSPVNRFYTLHDWLITIPS